MSEELFPRLEINIEKIFHNASTLVTRLGKKGISVTGIMKSTLGMPEIASEWLRAGVSGLGDSRIENIQTMKNADISAPMTLIRTPMMSQIRQTVRLSDISFNTEIGIIRKLSEEAKKVDCLHGVVLMVEFGDLREGIMPVDLEAMIHHTLKLKHITFMGIGTNLACRNGVAPDDRNMGELSHLADDMDSTFGSVMKVVSGGNSANLQWELDSTNHGRINNLRLGESMLLGCEPLHRSAIKGLYTNAFTLIAEIIELCEKPSEPWGNIAQSAFGLAGKSKAQGNIIQAILAIGRQDIDPEGLIPPRGIEILSASSDHLVIKVSEKHPSLKVGDHISFQLNYSALLRSMTSPFVDKVIKKKV